MNVIFEDDSLDRLETDSHFDAGLPDMVVKSFRKRMAQIRAALDERDFYAMKSLHFEKLAGKMQNLRSMRLNDQFRLVLRLEGNGPNKSVVIVAVEDYH